MIRLQLQLALLLMALISSGAAIAAPAPEADNSKPDDSAPAQVAAAVTDAVADKAMADSVAQLRHAIGKWNVTTEFLNEDSTVARALPGTYQFEWVIPDRVVSGRSDIPDIDQTAAILFYIDKKKEQIEMVSVGDDGNLWIMSGPLGGETRTTAPFATRDGGEAILRFTRYNVTRDSFESKMEYSSDAGKTWLPGNHQEFSRAD